jgi:general secretion pathway protein G
MVRRQLIIVLSMLLLFGSLACSNPYAKGKTDYNEAYLRVNLRTLRQAISSYTQDKRRPPTTLQNLVDDKYLAMIPNDPITDKPDWNIVLYECSSNAKCVEGIKDVRSSSCSRSSDGSPYCQW